MMITSGESLTEEEADEMMKLADKEGNGRVNYDGNYNIYIYMYSKPSIYNYCLWYHFDQSLPYFGMRPGWFARKYKQQKFTHLIKAQLFNS